MVFSDELGYDPDEWEECPPADHFLVRLRTWFLNFVSSLVLVHSKQSIRLNFMILSPSGQFGEKNRFFVIVHFPVNRMITSRINQRFIDRFRNWLVCAKVWSDASGITAQGLERGTWHWSLMAKLFVSRTFRSQFNSHFEYVSSAVEEFCTAYFSSS